MSFDGFGINGDDEYKSRIASFTLHVSPKQREELSTLWLSAPKLLDALRIIANAGESGELAIADIVSIKAVARQAITKAEGRGL